ncbi:MAG: protein kinase [Candidatus Obscuribacterales bacterium]|nr:protein kinase [Candidatus Obscuribacterales bacterium]
MGKKQDHKKAKEAPREVSIEISRETLAQVDSQADSSPLNQEALLQPDSQKSRKDFEQNHAANSDEDFDQDTGNKLADSSSLAGDAVCSRTGQSPYQIDDSADSSLTGGYKLVQSLIYHLPAKYEVLEQIGRGGMGTVFKAKHRDLDEIVAIKVLNPELLEKEGEALRRRFLTEAKAASRLHHPNLIMLKDYGVTEDGVAFMVMEFVEGESLEKYIAGKSRLEPKEAVRLGLSLCDGLHHAHSNGIIHRDIKPMNIFISTDQVPKILDFGIARVTSGGRTQGLTSTGEVFGSPLYIAPEQGLSSKVDERADIYSLGCVLYESVTGQPPYMGENAIQTVMMHLNSPVPNADHFLARSGAPPLPGGLSDVIAKCMAKEPRQRFQSVSELKAELELIYNGEMSQTGRNRTIEPDFNQGSPSTGAFKKVATGSQPRLDRRASSLKPSSNLAMPLIVLALFALVLTFFGRSLLNGFSNTSVSTGGALLQTQPQSQTLGLSQGGVPSAGKVKLLDKAFNMDTTKAFEAFNQGDYQSSMIMLKGTISVYDDELLSLRGRLERAEPEQSRLLNAEIERITWLKADNLQHVGNCLSHLGLYEDAIKYYRQAIDLYHPFAMRGIQNSYIDMAYEALIGLYNKVGKKAEAAQIGSEFQEVRAMRK